MAVLRDDSPIQYIKGIGPARAEWFAAAGLRTVGDLLAYYPYRYEIEGGETAIADLQPGVIATVRGEVSDVGGYGPTVTCELYDGTEYCTLRWFNQPYTQQRLTVGCIVVATGKTQLYNDRIELVQPRIQVFPPDTPVMSQPQGNQTRQVGVYRGTATLKSPLIRRAVRSLFDLPKLPVEEIIPLDLLKKHNLLPREAAVRQMHAPADEAELQRARRTLAYEEFLLMEMAIALRRRKLLSKQGGQKLHVTPEIDRRIRARFPFPLTSSQDAVIQDIARDLQSGRPMTRLLQGDVGSGKTVVALYACLSAIANGRQAAIMAPTEILAQQHFNNIERYLEGSQVRRVLLRGGQTKAKRAAALEKIERGEIDLIVGTQALLEKDVAFQKLALVVVDEQHKFGVMQRAEFRTKGPLPHYLVMTATPIPRTLAMTVFGDLDVSIIKQSPPGRGKIVTRVTSLDKWNTVMAYVRGRLEAGEQAYVVCPQIGKEDEFQDAADERQETDRRAGDIVPKAATVQNAAADRRESGRPSSRRPAGGRQDVGRQVSQQEDIRRAGGRRSGGIGLHPGARTALTTAKAAHEKLTAGPWRGLQVGLLHGGLPSAEKQAVIAAFAAGKLHAVVATTVVEVGVDVPNATIMVIENADRYGLSQLHQLRGRVGRGSKDSLCVLIARDAGEKAGNRLRVMAETTDGFRIAEADLQQRGPGELLGTKQHGLPELRLGDIVKDFELLDKAREDAFEIVARDPALQEPVHKRMVPALRRMFGDKLALIDAA